MYAPSLPSLPEDTLPGWKVIVEKLPKTGDRDDYVVIARPTFYYSQVGEGEEITDRYHIYRNTFSISCLEEGSLSSLFNEYLKRSLEEIKKAIACSDFRTRVEIPILDRFLRVGLGVV